MLIEWFPRAHARLAALPLLGPELDGLACQLSAQGLQPPEIRKRLSKATVLTARLQAGGLRQWRTLSRAQLLAFAPSPARQDRGLSALVRSLAEYLEARGVLRVPEPTPGERVLASYREFLAQVRGCAPATIRCHALTVRELLAFLAFDQRPAALQTLAAPHLEAFLKALARRYGRSGLQHAVAPLRGFLRFLASRDEAPPGLDTRIDRPRTHQDEHLPRALPWETVQAFLTTISRASAVGRRDSALGLRMATSGLRASEVAALRLDSVRWRAGELRVPCSKGRTERILPLTAEVGNAVLDYLRHGRPASPLRALFLRCLHPLRPLSSPAVQSAFRRCTVRSHAAMPVTGPHCLRHSLATHLLRPAQPLPAISAWLGHRSVRSTSPSLRLHEEALRTVALDLPAPREASR